MRLYCRYIDQRTVRIVEAIGACVLLSWGCSMAEERPNDTLGEEVLFEEHFELVEEVHLQTGNEPIGRISDLALWGERIAIADGLGANVKVFSWDGAMLLLIGQPGRGPGEFRDARSVAALEDERLLVLDGSTMEVSVFDRDGGFVKRWALESIGVGDLHIAQDGTSLLVAGLRRDIPGISPYTSVLMHLSLDGELLGTLGTVPMPEQHDAQMLAQVYTGAIGRDVVAHVMSGRIAKVFRPGGDATEFTFDERLLPPQKWPKDGFTSPIAIRQWVQDQLWPTELIAWHDEWLAVRLASYEGGLPAPPKYLLVRVDRITRQPIGQWRMSDSPWTLRESMDNEILATRMDQDGEVYLGRLRFLGESLTTLSRRREIMESPLVDERRMARIAR